MRFTGKANIVGGVVAYNRCIYLDYGNESAGSRSATDARFFFFYYATLVEI